MNPEGVFSGWLHLPDTKLMVADFVDKRNRLIIEAENLSGDPSAVLQLQRKLAQASVYRQLIDKYKVRNMLGE